MTWWYGHRTTASHPQPVTHLHTQHHTPSWKNCSSCSMLLILSTNASLWMTLSHQTKITIHTCRKPYTLQHSVRKDLQWIQGLTSAEAEEWKASWQVADERGHMKPEYGTRVQVPALWHTVWTSEGNVQPYAPCQEVVTGDTLLTDHFHQEFIFRRNCWEWLYSTWPHSLQSANTWNHLPSHAAKLALRVSPGTWH